MSDLIDRQAAIDIFDEFWGISLTRTIDAIKQLPSAQSKIEPLTDEEQRIFLSAMRREKEICEKIDRDLGGKEYYFLSRICKEIERKVKDALWT